MEDYDNVARYIPKKYHKDIKKITVELDFDNGRNRNVLLYTVNFLDESSVSAWGIKNLKEAVKNKYKENQND